VQKGKKMAPQGILGVFARSPIRPLQQHMKKAQACAEWLIPFFDAVLEGDWDQAKVLRTQITQVENEADELKMDFRLHMPKNIFLPVPRIDLLELLSKQDKIANISKDIAGIVLGRRMQIPTQLSQDLPQLVQLSVQASREALQATEELDELLESGFSNFEIEHVETIITQLNKTEHATDKLQIEIRQQLFDIEKELAPVDAIFLYQIIGWIGLIADCAQKVGARLRMLTTS